MAHATFNYLFKNKQHNSLHFSEKLQFAIYRDLIFMQLSFKSLDL